MSINQITAMTSGKYSDFKKEEYGIMLTRNSAINNVLTEKCKSVSLLPLGQHFSFDFEFRSIASFLKKIDDFDKKDRKDPLKKWWMNQKASEMATSYLPEILDRLDKVASTIAKQEKSELLQTKFEKYITFELLECALECKFSRPRAASSSVFPNTSFQYARSRLRKKLENIYFNETELTNMSASHKKKKDEWVKMIKTKKTKCKQEYFREKTKKQKLKKKHKRMKKQFMKHEANNNHKIPYLCNKHSISMSTSATMSESMLSSTQCSSDMPILDTINDMPPPPPPPPPKHNNNNNNNMEMKASAINMQNLNIPQLPKLPIFSAPSNNNNNNNNNGHGYCANCTSLNIQLSELTQQLHRYKITLGNSETEVKIWKERYEEKCNIIKQYKSVDKNMNYKHKYEQTFAELQHIKSQVFSLVSNSSNSGGRSTKSIKRKNSQSVNVNNNNIALPNIPNIVSNMMNGSRLASQDMSWKSSEFSVNAISDKMSISGGESVGQYNFMNDNTSTAPMSHIIGHHLKHNSNSTEKMLEQLTGERKEDGLSTIVGGVDMNHNINQQILCQDAENVLYPITNIHNNMNGIGAMNKSNASNDNNQSQSVTSQTTSHSNTHSTFSSMNPNNNQNNHNNFNNNNNVNYNISESMNTNNNNNNNNNMCHSNHHRSREHIRDLNGHQMFTDSNHMTMPKINDTINMTQTQVFVVNENEMNINNNNNNNNNNNINTERMSEPYWDGNSIPQFQAIQNNNMNYNNNNNNMNNMNANIQFPPSINHPQFVNVYDNNQ